MRQVQYDTEILYVQKLYFFLFFFTLSILSGLIITWWIKLSVGLVIFSLSVIISYILMIKKKTFNMPPKQKTAQRMAREISQDTSPLSVARFTSQLYYYFHESKQAISLLEKFLSTNDPLLCATLADVLFKEGKPRQALAIIRDNPYALAEPLLLATQGHILQYLGKMTEAIKMYERCLLLSRKIGFPHNGASWLTQRLLTLAYTASIHHSLADCYASIKEYEIAKRHYKTGNFHYFDLGFWRRLNSSDAYSAKNYTKSH